MIAIITARGGSKRIPRKNIKLFMGRPMLQYAIEACQGAGIFSDVMVSTDDAEIAGVAEAVGASVPFLRGGAADDHATTADALLDVIAAYKTQGNAIDAFCCVYPCVPFLRAETLRQSYDIFIEKKADSLMPVVPYSTPVQRSLVMREGVLSYAYPEYQETRSQDLETHYYDAGMFYFSRASLLFRTGQVVAGRIIPYVMKAEEVEDIDTMDDWHSAEIKFQLQAST